MATEFVFDVSVCVNARNEQSAVSKLRKMLSRTSYIEKIVVAPDATRVSTTGKQPGKDEVKLSSESVETILTAGKNVSVGQPTLRVEPLDTLVPVVGIPNTEEDGSEPKLTFTVEPSAAKTQALAEQAESTVDTNEADDGADVESALDDVEQETVNMTNDVTDETVSTTDVDGDSN